MASVPRGHNPDIEQAQGFSQDKRPFRRSDYTTQQVLPIMPLALLSFTFFVPLGLLSPRFEREAILGIVMIATALVVDAPLLVLHIWRVKAEARLHSPCGLSFQAVRRSLRRTSVFLLSLALLLSGGQALLFRQFRGVPLESLPSWWRWDLYAWLPDPPEDFRDLQPDLYKVIDPQSEKAFTLSRLKDFAQLLLDAEVSDSAGLGQEQATQNLEKTIADNGFLIPAQYLNGHMPQLIREKQIEFKPVTAFQKWCITAVHKSTVEAEPESACFIIAPNGYSAAFWFVTYELTRGLYSHHRGWWMAGVLLSVALCAFVLSIASADILKYLAPADLEIQEAKEAKP